VMAVPIDLPLVGACQDVCVSESVSGVDFLRC
jgi:hypothetical protein